MTVFHWVGALALVILLASAAALPTYVITRLVLRWREGR